MAQSQYLMALQAFSHNLKQYGARQIATQFHVSALSTNLTAQVLHLISALA
jgi:hypothetical protein